MAEKELTFLMIDCDWNGLREEMQHWACWRKSGRFRVFQDWMVTRIPALIFGGMMGIGVYTSYTFLTVVIPVQRNASR